jgi:hypothetical protein
MVDLTISGHFLKPLLMLPDPQAAVNKQAAFISLSEDPQVLIKFERQDIPLQHLHCSALREG